MAKNMTTQEYRRANFHFVSNPVYDKGVWKNVKRELFTYHPSLLATTIHPNKRRDIERRRSSNVSWAVCCTPSRCWALCLRSGESMGCEKGDGAKGGLRMERETGVAIDEWVKGVSKKLKIW